MASPAKTAAQLGAPARGSAAHTVFEAGVHAWRVLHLCYRAREIAPALEAQLASAMQAAVLTPGGLANGVAALVDDARQTPAQVSLLSAWREVRNWRRGMATHGGGFEIVHAHSFSAGMAAVRAGVPAVYDLHDVVEKTANSAEAAGHSWLLRSFRTAEQFVLARAGAVVVHSSTMYRAAAERGTPSENLFLVADAFAPGDADLHPLWVRAVAEKYDTIYSYVLNQWKAGRGPLLPPGWQPLAACF